MAVAACHGFTDGIVSNSRQVRHPYRRRPWLPTSEEWLEINADRSLARQRAKVDTAKLVVTFITAVAATMVATSLQVAPTTTFERAAAWFLGATLLAALAVALLDRLAEPDTDTILKLCQVKKWSETELIEELRAELIGSVVSNDTVIMRVMTATVVSVASAGVSGVLATLSLFGIGTGQ
jgi:hypothetical protein